MDKPIIMTAESVRAILAGTKTQTRRVIKPQPQELNTGRWYWQKRPNDDCVYVDYPNGQWWEYAIVAGECPYGAVGDRLWVKETWTMLEKEVCYLANSLNRNGVEDADSKRCRLDYGIAWRSPLFMPRWASRITLEITNVRVERVQDISEADAIAEGLCLWASNEGKAHYGISRADVWEQDPRLTYKRLWDAINAKRGYGWDTNRFVWAITFRRIDATQERT